MPVDSVRRAWVAIPPVPPNVFIVPPFVNRRGYASLVLRVALAATFLYSVADRFGWVGPPGAANVSWGTFSRFTSYVGTLNWFLPHSVIAVLAWIDTSLEVFLALMLLAGLRLRAVSFVSGLLLLAFATTMSVANSIGAPFQYSVFTASAAAFLLASQPSDRWSIDRLLELRAKAKLPCEQPHAPFGANSQDSGPTCINYKTI
jgi:uncharacterized membrane protein YphA (DoxX/SURF4 family)